MSKTVPTSLAALAMLLAAPAAANELRDDLAADMPGLMELYRDLHAHPELSLVAFHFSLRCCHGNLLQPPSCLAIVVPNIANFFRPRRGM